MANDENLVTVFGYGSTGAATVEQLRARGTPVRLVQRKRPAGLAAGVDFMACDVLNAEDVKRAMSGASQVVVAIRRASPVQPVSPSPSRLSPRAAPHPPHSARPADGRLPGNPNRQSRCRDH